MNKLSHDQVANHFYNLGVQMAVQGGMSKTASANIRRLVSRLAPMGGANMAAGAGHTLGGLTLGALAGAPLGADAAAYLGGIGALGGKVLKDASTLRLANQLGAVERMRVARALGDGVGGRVAGFGTSALTSGPIGALSEGVTNQLVRRRLGL